MRALWLDEKCVYIFAWEYVNTLWLHQVLLSKLWSINHDLEQRFEQSQIRLVLERDQKRENQKKILKKIIFNSFYRSQKQETSI